MGEASGDADVDAEVGEEIGNAADGGGAVVVGDEDLGADGVRQLGDPGTTLSHYHPIENYKACAGDRPDKG